MMYDLTLIWRVENLCTATSCFVVIKSIPIGYRVAAVMVMCQIGRIDNYLMIIEGN